MTSKPPTLKLYYRLGGVSLTYTPATHSFVLGRGDAADGVTLHLPEGSVAKRHARIFWEQDSWHVEDLKSPAGIVVNERPANDRASLSDGDQLRLGQLLLTVQLKPA
jgi:pSer/pThr/pTyr-binding forkhead associated (FHA) protein